MNDLRFQQLTQWLSLQFDDTHFSIQPIANDASFRRYFRVLHHGESAIAMDSPPDKENNLAFVSIANTFSNQHVHVPKIFHSDLEQGFLLLSDLGSRLYLNELNPSNADKLYQNAFDELIKIQQCRDFTDWKLPSFDADFIQTELQRFIDWFLQAYLQIDLDKSTLKLINDSFKLISDSILAQPIVCVHRDYHSRNLLINDETKIGVIDFQDAVFGPVTYDLVSLLKDCYINWPTQQVEEWALQYLSLLNQHGIFRQLDSRFRGNDSKFSADETTFLYWFHMMGIQRHLKVLGIFARLYKRDNKSGYLKDLPRTLNYIIAACGQEKRLTPLQNFLRDDVQPKLLSKLKDTL